MSGVRRTEQISVAVVSDTHGFIDPRIGELVAGCDIVVHAGDIGSAEVLGCLKPLSGQVFAVLGNNDVAAKWSTVERRWLGVIPSEQQFHLPGGSVSVEHGHRIWDTRRYHYRLRQKHPGARAIIYGHTHVQIADTSSLPWVINPGAAGRIRSKGGPSCTVLYASLKKWRLEQHRFEVLPY